MEDSNSRRIPWALFVSELIGTTLLVLVGLSLVILMFGTGIPKTRLIPSEELRRRSQAPAQTPHATLAHRSSPGNGRAGGFTESGRWPECFWPSSPAVSLRSPSKSPNCTTLKATANACFTAWPGPGCPEERTHERPLSHRLLGPTRGESLESHQVKIGTATIICKPG